MALLAAAGYGVQVWRYWARHVSTDAAFVEARVSPVSAKIRGTVVEVLVEDNRAVKQGDVLVRLDPRDHQVKLEQARNRLGSQVLARCPRSSTATAAQRIYGRVIDIGPGEIKITTEGGELEVKVPSAVAAQFRKGDRVRLDLTLTP